MIRINLASNTNRSLLKIALTAERANLKNLTTLAKDKLRLKGIKGFYKSSGRALQEGELLEADMLLLVHRGEEFVGKITQVPEIEAASQSPHMNSTIFAAPTCFERAWYHTGQTRARQTGLRIMTFNILAPVLAQGSESMTATSSEKSEGLAAQQNVDIAENTSDDAASVIDNGARSVGVHYATKPKGVRQLSHNFCCAPEHLAWGHRLPSLQGEVLHHDPDLLCLQEMDAVAWPDCQRFLCERGYNQGVCSKALGGANNFIAMFWKQDQMKEVGEPEVVYLGAQGTASAIIHRLRVLGGTETEHEIVVVTTHLKAGIKEKSEQERAKEISDLLLVLQNFTSLDDDILLCGDLNAHIGDLPFYGCGAEAMSPLRALVLPLLHKKGFRCSVSEVTNGVPLQFSQWCSRGDVEIKSTIDHILLRGPRIIASDVLMAPEDSVIIAMGCLPNKRFPSDHIPVVVDVVFRGGSDVGSHTCAYPAQAPLVRQPSATIQDKEVLSLGRELAHDGRVAITEDGFKYIALPKWQHARERLQNAAVGFAPTIANTITADRSALERQLTRRYGINCQADGEWEIWSPPCHVGLHISLGKHADTLNVGKRVRFQLIRLLHFQSRKLGEPSQWSEDLFGARWFTFEVRLIDEVRCEGTEPHISFAMFGWRRRQQNLADMST